jgi:hypothetical protein
MVMSEAQFEGVVWRMLLALRGVSADEMEDKLSLLEAMPPKKNSP